MKNNKNFIKVNKKDITKALKVVNKMDWAFADDNNDEVTDCEDKLEDILHNMLNEPKGKLAISSKGNGNTGNLKKSTSKPLPW